MNRKRLNFLKGFAVGVALIALSKAGGIVQGGPLLADPGLWIDWAVQALIVGVIAGVIGAWIGERRRKQP